MNIELNKNGINKKIKVNLLADEKMKRIGFTNYKEGFWYFSKLIASDISFNVVINKNDIEDLCIDILDEEFGQPYDYQNILEDNKDHKFALCIKSGVEYWMRYLQENEVLNGHKYGEYI